MSDLVERLRKLAAVDNCQASLAAADRIEQLEAALRMIRDNEPERLAWSVGYARAALEVHSIGHEDGLCPREHT